MHFTKIFVALFTVSVVVAHPMFLEARAPPAKAPAKPPAKAPAKPLAKAKGPSKPVVTVGPGGSVEDQMRRQNLKPGRVIPQKCKMPIDCTSCPGLKGTNGAPRTVVSCDVKGGGWCNCDNKQIAAIAMPITDTVMKGLKEMGNSTVFKALTGLAKGFEDIKEVAKIVLGAVLPPGAKQAVKAFFQAWPTFISSHIDDATKGIVGDILSKL